MASEPATSTLSPRGAALASGPSYRLFATPLLSNLYHPTKNPTGIVNLSAAENYPMLPAVSTFANANFATSPEAFSYNEGAWGTARLRAGLARHMNRTFHPVVEIKPDDLLLASGCMSLCELLGFALCSPGDGVLMSAPIYSVFPSDFGTKAGAHCVNARFDGTDQFAPEAAEHYERALLAAEEKGIKIHALMLCHPHNPLGQAYPRETLVAIMRLCQRHKIHLISDEIYALSCYDVPGQSELVKWESALAFDSSEYIDPRLLHVLYGLSKDFAAGGLRIGCLYTRNTELWKAISAMMQFHWIGGANDEVACRMLEDDKWLDGFFAESRKRLGEQSELARSLLSDKGVRFWEKANTGFFLWVDLRPFLRGMGKEGWEAEKELEGRIAENKVLLNSGASMRAEESGWFRLVFSLEEDALRLGLARLFEALGM